MACKIRIRVKKKKYIRGDNTTMKYTSIIIPFVGGLGMFIYGMQIMAQGLENAAGNRMKSLLEALTKNKFFGVLLGAFITAVIQSSSATTVMVVGFVNAGIMNLQQAMGVIMGANIGTTVTGWLVSSVEWAKFLSPSNLAPVAIMIGVIIMLTGKRRSTKDIASIVVGFGLLFVGISSMSSAVEPLKDNAAFCNIFVSLGHNPLLGIVAFALYLLCGLPENPIKQTIHRISPTIANICVNGRYDIQNPNRCFLIGCSVRVLYKPLQYFGGAFHQKADNLVVILFTHFGRNLLTRYILDVFIYRGLPTGIFRLVLACESVTKFMSFFKSHSIVFVLISVFVKHTIRAKKIG